MPDTVWPQDVGMGAPTNDWVDAASMAWALDAVGVVDTVVSGMTFTPDYSNNQLDIAAGKAVLTDSSADTVDHGLGVETRSFGVAFVVEMTARSNLSLTGDSTNHVYLSADPTADDAVSVTINTTDTPPSDPHVKLGTVDDLNQTYVEQNRGKTADTFSEVLEGRAVADNGLTYDSVQTAIQNATDYVLVGPGQFDETLSISTSPFELIGSGREATTIGSSSQPGGIIDIAQNTPNVSIRDLRVENDPNGTTSKATIQVNSYNADLRNLTIGPSMYRGIAFTLDSGNCSLSNTRVKGPVTYEGIYSQGVYTHISNVYSLGATGGYGIFFDTDADSSVAFGNIVQGSSTGIKANANDVIMTLNRCHNNSYYGLYHAGVGGCVGLNRLSGNGTQDLRVDDAGAAAGLNDTGALN